MLACGTDTPTKFRDSGADSSGSGGMLGAQGGAAGTGGSTEMDAAASGGSSGVGGAGTGGSGAASGGEAGLGAGGAAGNSGASCGDADGGSLIDASTPFGDASAPDGGSDAGAPTIRPAIDVGYYMHAFSTSGETLQSFHWESPDSEHQSYFAGNQNLSATGVNVERRPYFVFDLSVKPNAVTRAQLQLWVWKPATANNNSGAYNSDDPCEIFEIHRVESFTPAEVMSAPFNQTTDHSVDVPIWVDLGDGPSLGTRVYTIRDEQEGLVPSPTTSPDTDCATPDAACGKWIHIELNAEAVGEINATDGQWVIGARLSTIAPNPDAREWVNNGVLSDLAVSKLAYPDFVTPLPRLVIESLP